MRNTERPNDRNSRQSKHTGAGENQQSQPETTTNNNARKAKPSTYTEAVKQGDTGEPPLSDDAQCANKQCPPLLSPGSTSSSSSEESTDAFRMFACYATDDSLINSLETQAQQMVTRKAKGEQRAFNTRLGGCTKDPFDRVYRQGHTAGRLATKDLLYVRERRNGEDVTPTSSNTTGKRWDDGVKAANANLANNQYVYSPSKPRILCPDSGATTTMAPFRDMFVDYVDLRQKGLILLND